ncbi:MAG: cysteine--tRNA ligase [Candidatus Aenigmarchaeota archaeon]|nr:cysteine--tRNA ligase [Candidatus Aenigmarchaeota archaeon]
MAIKFFNTLTRRKEVFKPMKKKEVRMYTCGPTVYNYAHIGNFRTYVWQDILKRWLIYRGFRVKHVMNLTDVDDRTIKGSRKEGISLKEFTERYSKAFFEDSKVLNILPADVYPRATEHIEEIVKLIKILIQKGYAYRGEDGSIYYDISKFKDYGKLSKLRIKELKAGARIKADSYTKKEAYDFALWKAWDPEDGDVFWETEIGKGRPGWHTECSAMSMKYLGETFDIHTGGVDLIFPHHENEIAQSEAATGKKFVNYWLHAEHLIVEGKKMSKSLGNFYTLRDLLEKGYDAIAIRYLLLSTHYKQQLNFTFKGLEAAKNTVESLLNFVSRLKEIKKGKESRQVKKLIEEIRKKFEEAMDDNLRINDALAAMFKFVNQINRLIAENKIGKNNSKAAIDLILDFDKILGLNLKEAVKEEKLPKGIQELIKKREEARRKGDWKTADEIRNRIKELGYAIEDTKEGVRWKKIK